MGMGMMSLKWEGIGTKNLFPRTSSSKLNPTQAKWSTIEKETYATIWALKKFRKWIFGKPSVVYTDHNPITYLTDAAPKSAKLMRWALAIQEYDVRYSWEGWELVGSLWQR